MSVISGIVPAHPPGGRFAVLVDGRERAVLSLDAIERLGLAVGRSVAGLEEAIALESAAAPQLRPRAEHARAPGALVQRAGALARAEGRGEGQRRLGDRPAAGAGARSTMRRSPARSRAPRSWAANSRGGAWSRIWRGRACRGASRDEAIDDVFEEEAVDQRAIVEEAARKKLRSLAGLEPAVQRRRLYALPGAPRLRPGRHPRGHRRPRDRRRTVGRRSASEG